jgi:hypothetical protein
MRHPTIRTPQRGAECTQNFTISIAGRKSQLCAIVISARGAARLHVRAHCVACRTITAGSLRAIEPHGLVHRHQNDQGADIATGKRPGASTAASAPAANTSVARSSSATTVRSRNSSASMRTISARPTIATARARGSFSRRIGTSLFHMHQRRSRGGEDWTQEFAPSKRGSRAHPACGGMRWKMLWRTPAALRRL